MWSRRSVSWGPRSPRYIPGARDTLAAGRPRTTSSTSRGSATSYRPGLAEVLGPRYPFGTRSLRAAEMSGPVAELPPNLPVPVDDGACDELPGKRFPPLGLPSTSGGRVDLSKLAGRVVVYCYPHTGRPGEATPAEWDAIPGARGCTPQSCSFRDHHAEFGRLGATVFGMSVDEPAWQREAAERVHLPFELLSDSRLRRSRGPPLRTFEFNGRTYVKRLTMVASAGRIEKVFYPVFPPDRNVVDVLEWLRR